MRTFTDNAGRTWTIDVHVTAIKRVKSLTNVNLLDLGEGKLLEQLSSDPVLLVDVLYALCKPEADARHISDEDFGMAMAGDAIDHATTALLEELVDFFPGWRRQILAKALRKLDALKAKALAVISKRLDDPRLDQQLEALLQQNDLPENAYGS